VIAQFGNRTETQRDCGWSTHPSRACKACHWRRPTWAPTPSAACHCRSLLVFVGSLPCLPNDQSVRQIAGGSSEPPSVPAPSHKWSWWASTPQDIRSPAASVDCFSARIARSCREMSTVRTLFPRWLLRRGRRYAHYCPSHRRWLSDRIHAFGGGDGSFGQGSPGPMAIAAAGTAPWIARLQAFQRSFGLETAAQCHLLRCRLSAGWIPRRVGSGIRNPHVVCVTELVVLCLFR